jgi:hypothetical protein
MIITLLGATLATGVELEHNGKRIWFAGRDGSPCDIIVYNRVPFAAPA